VCFKLLFSDFSDRADIKGADMNNMIWYIPDEAGQPAGPYSTEKISEWLTAAQIPRTTLCWREGMDDWRPLSQVRPFCEILPDRFPSTNEAGAEAQGFDDLGKMFGKAVNLTKKKAKIVSLKMSIGKHEKCKHQILFELGKMLYEKEGDSEILSQSPYIEKIQQARAQDKSIQTLHKEIETIENAGLVNPKSQNSQD
jgi:hypothetical protein